jgi:hypothetical protein
VIKNFVVALVDASALSDVNVEVLFDESNGALVLPTTCQPEVPAGWSFDSTNNVWLNE